MENDLLLDNFKRYFRVIYANNQQLRKHVYKIRYDVFCDELKLEENCPQDVEKDEFDAYAHHFLLQHKPSGEYAGTARFVLPSNQAKRSLLPFEKYCSNAIDKRIINPALLLQGSYGEVSRLAVPARFRKRSGEQGKPYAINDDEKKSTKTEDDKRHFPHISVGLYLACAAFFVHEKIDYAFVMVEPRLARCIARLGIRFDQAGKITDYHGQRAPFYISQAMLATHLKPAVKPLFEYIKKELAEQLDSNEQALKKNHAQLD